MWGYGGYGMMMYDEDAVFRHVTAVLSTWYSCVQLQQQNE